LQPLRSMPDTQFIELEDTIPPMTSPCADTDRWTIPGLDDDTVHVTLDEATRYSIDFAGGTASGEVACPRVRQVTQNEWPPEPPPPRK